jgi:hypothetical protein
LIVIAILSHFYSREVLALKPERYGLTNENEAYNLAGK